MTNFDGTREQRFVVFCAFRRRKAGWFGIAVSICAGMSLAGGSRADVLTQRSDIGRTGVTADAAISPSSFDDGKWTKLGELPVDGVIYAQPLYVQGLIINGVSRDVVYVATATNRVYAFDAVTRALIWDTGANFPGPDDSLNAFAGPGTEQACALGSATRLVGPGSPSYGVGISSTPVIDRTAGFLYLTYRTINLGIPLQRVAKLSLTTGAITWQSITSSFDGTKNQALSGLRQRTSLLLDQGMIYAGFGMTCEGSSRPEFKYRGTVLAIDQSSLTVKGKFDTLPLTDPNNPATKLLGGGVWQAGTGIAADPQSHRLYFSTGNPDPLQSQTLLAGPPIYGNMVLSVFPDINATTRNVTFQPPDLFMPWRASWLGTIDLDLGAAGVVVPPDIPEVIAAGKEGIVYVLNRFILGGTSSAAWGPRHSPQEIPFCSWGHAAPCIADPSPTAQCDPSSTPTYTGLPDSAQAESFITQKFIAGQNMDCVAPPMNNWSPWPHIHGTPVFGTLAAAQYLYVWPEKGQLRAYLRNTSGPTYRSNLPNYSSATSANDPNMPGGMLTLATNAGNGVLFAALPIETFGINGFTQRGALVAFNATPGTDGTLKQLWGDYQQVYYNAKYVPPTVGGGKVFLATGSNKVIVYGRNTSAVPVASHRTNLAAILHDPTNSAITAAFVRPDGRIQIYGEVSSGSWTSYATLGTFNNEFPAGAPLALAKQGTQLDVMGIGVDQKLHVYKTTATQAPTSWTAVPPVSGASSLPANAPLAFQYRTNELDVFVVDVNGTLELLKVPNTAGSTSWTAQAIAGTTGMFPLLGRAGLAADIRVDQGQAYLSVFGVNNQGRLCAYSSNVVTMPAFSGGPIPPTAVFAPGAHLATGHQGSGSTDSLNLFLIGGPSLNAPIEPDDNMNDGLEYNNFIGTTSASTQTRSGSLFRVVFSQATHAWSVKSIKRRFTPIGIPVGYSPGVPGGDIAVAKQYPDQLDVFYTSGIGAVIIYATTEGTPDTWNRFFHPSYAMPGSSLVVVPQHLQTNGFPDDLELLVASPEHIYRSEHPPGSGPWNAPIAAGAGL
jgi:hypothetical protein